jgi:hypothetical protein
MPATRRSRQAEDRAAKREMRDRLAYVELKELYRLARAGNVYAIVTLLERIEAVQRRQRGADLAHLRPAGRA